MATRVFELARELTVRSKDVLEKCRAEGIDVKNHMTSLSAGLEETIRDWFSDANGSGAQHTAVETAEHVDIEKVRKKAKKARKRMTAKQKAEAAAAEALAKAEPEEAETQALPGEAAPEPVESTAKPKKAKKKVERAKKEDLQTAPEEPPTEAPAESPKEPEPIKPAGPQVVPRPAQLKGPRVVRVEKPDYTPRPQRREPLVPSRESFSPSVGRRGALRDGLKEERKKLETEGEVRSKKSTRRSPRRKTGRTADSGEKPKKWRDQDLLERSERIAGAGYRFRRRRAAVSRGSGAQLIGGAKTGNVEIEEPITVKSLSATTGIKGAEIIKKLMELGTMATINQVIDPDVAEAAVVDYGIDLIIARAKTAEDELIEKLDAREKTPTNIRAPVVTFLGHVDHGKTSLLDRIRKTSVASAEAGGITQAIGAYRHDYGERHVVFLDTPGHEAFTAMRARGANMTDVVVLVVAADDGVMPQTIEAISHAKAAGVPIVVALNKIDVPNANVQRALGQLSEYDLQPREWGGQTEVIQTSAETGEGIDDLVELLSLEAEILELQAETDAPANGYVVEAKMDPSQGVVASLLVLNGTLRCGDVLLAGCGFGRVRQIYDDKGNPLQQAPPSTPVAVTGLDEVPDAGDRFFVVKNIDQARSVAEQRRSEDRAKTLALAATAPKNLEELIGKIEDGEVSEIPVIIKADVQGSIEAIVGVLEKIGTEETRINILHTGVGGISTGDVTLAEASGAIIIGFDVVADAQARKLAESQKIDIRLYRVIYDITEDMRGALEKGLIPEIREKLLGRGEVRQTFKVSRIGTIAGLYITEGLVQRNAMVRIIRDNVVIEDERVLDSLRRIKDDAREVRAGLECGVKITGYNDIKEGDVLEFYQKIEVARTL